jgi:hypothetical protein
MCPVEVACDQLAQSQFSPEIPATGTFDGFRIAQQTRNRVAQEPFLFQPKTSA